MRQTFPTEAPLAVIGCDFRTASPQMRGELMLTADERHSLLQAMRRTDGGAGLMVLETCNRIEWIVGTANPEWMSHLLASQMSSRWRRHGRSSETLPRLRVLTGERALDHLLRVVTGLESMAKGEAEISGQFQHALRRALVERTSNAVIRALATLAGRIAKAATRLGVRSASRAGVHQLVVAYLRRGLEAPPRERRRAVVVGMGSIGRRTADALEAATAAEVVRINRTVGEDRPRNWAPLHRLAAEVAGADAVVIATAASDPPFSIDQFAGAWRSAGRADGAPRLVVDIGVPPQVAGVDRLPSGVSYAGIDDLVQHQRTGDHTAGLGELEEEIEVAKRRFRGVLSGQMFSSLLHLLQEHRQDYLSSRIRTIVDQQLGDLTERDRDRIESVAGYVIREYAHHVFSSILTHPADTDLSPPADDEAPGSHWHPGQQARLLAGVLREGQHGNHR